jgi:hypothetical protein
MTRWTLLVIAATAACGDRGDRPSSDTSSTTIADTAPPTGPAAMESTSTTATKTAPAAPASPSKVEEIRPPGTRATKPGQTPEVGPDRGPTGAEAMGGVRSPTPTAAPGAATAPQDLTADQVKRLQTALNNAGCSAGAADGRMGPGTRRAIACGLKKNGLRSNDYRGLYRSLNLNF